MKHSELVGGRRERERGSDRNRGTHSVEEREGLTETGLYVRVVVQDEEIEG